MVATKRKPRRFPSMSLFREYAEYAESTRAVTARTKFQTLKNYKQTFDRCSWGWCFFPTSTADAALKEAVDWLSTVSRFDVIRQMRLMLVTLLAEVALMSLLLVWRGLRALIL
jgi:hypothetical protein